MSSEWGKPRVQLPITPGDMWICRQDQRRVMVIRRDVGYVLVRSGNTGKESLIMAADFQRRYKPEVA